MRSHASANRCAAVVTDTHLPLAGYVVAIWTHEPLALSQMLGHEPMICCVDGSHPFHASAPLCALMRARVSKESLRATACAPFGSRGQLARKSSPLPDLEP
jgi:hypothetical protein